MSQDAAQPQLYWVGLGFRGEEAEYPLTRKRIEEFLSRYHRDRIRNYPKGYTEGYMISSVEATCMFDREDGPLFGFGIVGENANEAISEAAQVQHLLNAMGLHDQEVAVWCFPPLTKIL